jgi:hypothetical protein
MCKEKFDENLSNRRFQTKIQRCSWYLFLIMSKFLHSFWPWNCQHLIEGQCEISDILISLVDSWMQPSSWGFRAMETPTWSRPPHNTERLSRVQLATSLIATVISTTNFSRGAWKLCYFQLYLVALYYHSSQDVTVFADYDHNQNLSFRLPNY